MDDEIRRIKDKETLSFKDTDNRIEHDYELQEAGKKTFELEIESTNYVLSGNDYPPVYEEELIVEPVLSVFQDDPFELNSDIEGEEADDELGSSVFEDIMECVYCEFCKEYSYVTKSSFHYKLQSFCDKCYHNHMRKFKDEWMNQYESCLVCMNSLLNSLDMVKHDCACKNFYYCDNCCLIFFVKEDLVRHEKMCVNQSSSLDIISKRKSVVRKTGLKRKISSTCSPKDKIYIVRCKEGFVDSIKKKSCGISSNREKKKYAGRSHRTKRYKCDNCDKFFSSPSDLKKHSRIHTRERLFPCNFCEKSFSDSSKLERHTRSHTGEKPFSCELCNKSFSESSSLKRHLRTHTGFKPFSCNFCEKSFTQSGLLKRHLLTHTDKKPFICEICRKSFSEKYRLKCHLRTHTGEKPFICEICEKSFCENYRLKYHLRTHTGEKPFLCRFCEKSFSETKLLKRHLKVHSVVQPSSDPPNFIKGHFLDFQL